MTDPRRSQNMLTHLWRSIGFGSAMPDQTPIDPLKELIVVSDKDREEDDFCEISVRPMTWAEVASGAMPKSRKVVVKTPRGACNRADKGASSTKDAGQENAASRHGATVSKPWESNEMYGHLEDNYVSLIEKKRRRKSIKKHRDNL